MKNAPYAHTIFKWLRDNGQSLAGLTGADYKALAAATQIIGLYAYDRDPEILFAFAVIVRRMQPGMRYLAYHAIAHVLDWSDRAIIWVGSGLETPTTITICTWGPGGAHR